MGDYLLEMRHITKEFPGVRALDDVHLAIRPGTVHSLMGENGAGKSTLMKCLFGIYVKDSGTILLDGREVDFRSPRQALDSGVAMVHQELNQVHTRSVMENIWLGRFPKTKLGSVDHREMYRRTKEIFDDLAIGVDPKAVIRTLSVSQRQMVEIAKAVSFNSRILVFDEPTSSLAETEVEQLFGIIRMLRERGCGIVYISHKMNEILRISDEVTVMRDGKWVATTPAGELTMEILIRQMVGREITNVYPEKTNVPGEVVLEVEGLTATYLNLRDVSFTARRGEILGFAGLVGAGRTELMETLFGVATKKSGTVSKGGRIVNNRNSTVAMRNGFALITEERRQTGIFGVLDVMENTTVANIRAYVKNRLYLSDRDMRKDTDWAVETLKVKTPSQKTKLRSLSGGNQQKVIVGRWLLTKPDVLLLDEPTRGIDVGAKYEIYQLMIDLAKSGKAVLMVSSEMPELLGVCDRIIVMSNGRIAGEVDARRTSQEEILTLAAKYV
ncbi:MAG: Galactose/methyl galactoside import ATP-binding protein MglA [Firmicutes bacterium ADurb.Bin248]|nr:MAG: Galactose/methyl galactoside import ATP-binding protein MglA [Firmicutes bacterium ADurb.Bin248]HOF99943.1 ATP-binding cassette domain-containing protein [Clostridia bacterium]HPK14441.1 ATP-binding cassette domain-containing protein [Clostridia bacterium]